MAVANIHLYCACDRQNYGDLLFPIILTHQLKKMHYHGAIHYFGTVKSDLSLYGAIPTRSIKEYKKLSDKNEKHLLIIAGGEVLAASWPKILSFIAKNTLIKKALHYLDRAARKFPFINTAISYWFSFPSSIPFALKNGEYKNTTIAYNAVGGVYLKTAQPYHQKRVFDALSSSYISVRDKETYTFLTQNNVQNVILAPDCAFILSDIFPLKELEQKISQALKEALPKGVKYFCFQAAPSKLNGNEKSAQNAIHKICLENNLKCVSFSIAEASGHEDQKTVEMLASAPELRGHIIPIRPKSIYDVMFIIAMSECYIGTSLHGLITAISYRRPAFGLHPVTKIKATIDSWLSPEMAMYSEAKDLPENFQPLIKQSQKFDWENSLSSIKKDVYQNLERINQFSS